MQYLSFVIDCFFSLIIHNVFVVVNAVKFLNFLKPGHDHYCAVEIVYIS